MSSLTTPGLVPPNGLEQILQTFGDIYEYIRPDGSLDPRWPADYLARVDLPFALALSWDHTRSVSYMTCNRKLVEVFGDVFEQIRAGGLQAKLSTFGGCFAFRQQRTGKKLSTHAWGIAIDLNPETNPQGAAGEMDLQVIAAFRKAGFQWGGDWAGKAKDGMHFQFCTGY